MKSYGGSSAGERTVREELKSRNEQGCWQVQTRATARKRG